MHEDTKPAIGSGVYMEITEGTVSVPPTHPRAYAYARDHCW